MSELLKPTLLKNAMIVTRTNDHQHRWLRFRCLDDGDTEVGFKSVIKEGINC